MRLRLAQTLALMLTAAVAVALAGMGAVTAWNLRHGFNDYLVMQDTERFERFASMVERSIADAGGLDGLAARGMDLPRLAIEFARAEGKARVPGPALGDELPPGEPTGEPEGGPPGGPADFIRRIELQTLDGRPMLSRPLPRAPAGPIQRTLYVNGLPVARLLMLPAPPVPDGAQTAFLRRQYLGIAGVAALVLSLSFVWARWLARRWVEPLVAVNAAAAQVARGDFAHRLVGARSGAGRQDELGEVVDSINRMAESLQTLESARRRWLAEISHELRTPLTVLRGEVDALMDGVRPVDHQALVSLQQEVARLSRLIDDLHLLALSDLQAMPCEPAPADAATIFSTSVQRASRRFADSGLSLEVAYPDTGIEICWDATRIGQLLDNLLDNSLKYTDAPGRVRLQLAADDSQVSITLDDSAPGVPPADLGRLFDPLYRADPARSRKRGGSGLGLSICRAIVHAHAGHIEAAASALGGLRIVATLPRNARKLPA